LGELLTRKSFRHRTFGDVRLNGLLEQR
jgi:hypothetical protein